MTRRIFLALAPPSLFSAAKKSQSRGPEIQLLEAVGKAEGGKIAIDGRAKNVAERPIRKLTVVYEILDSDKNVLSSQKGEVDDQEPLAPGQEITFRAEMSCPPRAVSFRLSFEDVGERELRSSRNGPFPVE